MASTSVVLAAAVLLVLLVAAAAAAADAAQMPSPIFVDWISQQQASSTKAKAAGYDDLETESVCLTQTKLRNCRALNTVDDGTKAQSAHEETPMACCHQGSFMTETALMGVCSWTSDMFEAAVQYDGTNTEKIGVFTVKCEMREDSEKCGSPLCEGMSLDGSGDILRYPKVAFVGESATEPIPTDDACSTLDLLEPPSINTTPKSSAPKKQGTATGPGTPRTPAKAQWQGLDGAEEAPKYYLGVGHIYSGTFRVTSRFHATKAAAGQIQVAYAPEALTASQGVSTVPEKAYVARAHQVHLEFLGAVRPTESSSRRSGLVSSCCCSRKRAVV